MHPLRWPLWRRSLTGGLVSAGFMYGFVGHGPYTVLRALTCLVGGVVFGLAIWGVTRAQDRRLFGDLTEAERAAGAAPSRAARMP